MDSSFQPVCLTEVTLGSSGNPLEGIRFVPAQRYASAVLAVVVCLTVRLSLKSRCSTKTLNLRSRKQRHTIAQ